MKYQEHQDYQRRYMADYVKTPRGKYAFHKSSAKQRGIPFLLTFEEWWAIWRASGKWKKRGRLANQYVMARFRDQGGYELGNVRICLSGENTNEMRQGLPPRTKQTPEEVKAVNREYRRRERARERQELGLGPIDVARSESAFGRRMVVRDGRRCWAHPGEKDYPR